MLSMLSSSLAYNAPLAVRPAVTAHSTPHMMAKSESLPFMEEPAHLSGMIGNVGFDPMGLSTPQNIKWMREAELKHGRMTMLAWAGWVSVDLGMKFPGARYADLSSYKAAVIVDGKSLLDQSVGYEMLMLFLFVGAAARLMQCPLWLAPGPKGSDGGGKMAAEAVAMVWARGGGDCLAVQP